MAFDGFAVAAVTDELDKKLQGGRIMKISQPGKDELMFTIAAGGGKHRLLLSANPSLPMICLTNREKEAPLTAPSFCMLLRKHLLNGRIISFKQPSLERVVRMETEHLNELGDLQRNTLVIELMGKYSNIILTKEEGGEEIVVDAIKRVSMLVSSVREVLPGRPYFIPDAREKISPLDVSILQLKKSLSGKGMEISRALQESFTGFSYQVSSEIVRLSGTDLQLCAGDVAENEDLLKALYESFERIVKAVKDGNFTPVIYMEGGSAADFAAIDTGMYEEKECFDSASAMLEQFFARRDEALKKKEKSAGLRKSLLTCRERTARKLELQEKQLNDTGKMERYRLFGELITAYAYKIPEGADHYDAENYYDGSIVKIPLEKDLTASENAKRFYDRYTKLKRTAGALTEQTANSRMELYHIESMLSSLDTSENEADLMQVAEEMQKAGYVRKRLYAKKKNIKTEPLEFVCDEGFRIFVGKNNLQNEYVSFKLAGNSDMWFHAKKIPGSHVIVKTEGKELPDTVYEKAASLAAYYSSASDQAKVEVDYTLRKNLKKPPGSPPGFVIYNTNYSMTVKPSKDGFSQRGKSDKIRG